MPRSDPSLMSSWPGWPLVLHGDWNWNLGDPNADETVDGNRELTSWTTSIMKKKMSVCAFFFFYLIQFENKYFCFDDKTVFKHQWFLQAPGTWSQCSGPVQAVPGLWLAWIPAHCPRLLGCCAWVGYTGGFIWPNLTVCFPLLLIHFGPVNGNIDLVQHWLR